MHVSWSEMEMLACKAALGIGVPVGLAEEAGVAVTWLGRAGCSGAAIIWRALENISNGRAHPVVIQEKNCLRSKITGTLSSALYAAPSVSDFLHSVPEIKVERLDEPLLLFGYLAASSSMLDSGFVFQSNGSGDKCWQGVIENGYGRIDGQLLQDHQEHSGADVTVTAISASEDWIRMPDSSEIETRHNIRNTMEVTETEMINLQRLSAHMLVPETIESKTKGAGAGVVDTD